MGCRMNWWGGNQKGQMDGLCKSSDLDLDFG